MQPATMTYILQCSSCGVRGEIGEYTETYVCPKCHGKMVLSEARISGDDPLIDALLDQMISKAECGDVASRKSLAFLADSTNEHTRISLENAWYRKKYPGLRNTQKQSVNNSSIPAQKVTPTYSSQTSELSNARRNMSPNLPPHHVPPNGILNADRLPPIHTNIRTISSNNTKADTMKNKIPVELDSDYEIRGKMTAFLDRETEKKETFTVVRLLADIEFPKNVKDYAGIKICIYDEDGDIVASGSSYLNCLCYGNKIRIPEYATVSKVVVRTRKDD